MYNVVGMKKLEWVGEIAEDKYNYVVGITNQQGFSWIAVASWEV